MPLPKSWQPTHLHDLVRIGAQRDGGYVLPKRLLKRTKYLIGLGLCDDWSFEEDFQKQSGARVVCYDHTTTKNFWRKRFLMDCARLVLKKNKKKSFSSLFDYLRYKKFFDGQEAVHHQQKIGYANKTDTDLSSIINTIGSDHLFLKIDIEGAEYRILKQIAHAKARILGFVIEFHDVDILSEHISRFIERIKEHFTVVHIHANNCGGIDEKCDPLVVEMTWMRNDQMGADEEAFIETYPIEGLDQANTAEFPDIALLFSEE